MSEGRIICIAGKNQIAIDGVECLLHMGIKKTNILGVHNKTDLGVDSWQPSFRKYCLMNDIKLGELSDIFELDNLVFISLEFDRIVDPSKFRSEQLFNIHFSALPKFKGMYTSLFPILEGESRSGVTLHCIDKGIDTGKIIDQIIFEIGDHCTGLNLYFQYLQNGKKLLERNIKRLITGDVISVPQLAKNSTYFSKDSIDFSNLAINFRQTAFQVANYVNAFSFRPYQLLSFNNFKIVRCFVTECPSKTKPGFVLCENEFYFEVSTIDYNVRLLKDNLDLILYRSEMNDVESISEFHQQGFDLGDRNERGWNSLIVASFFGNVELVEFISKIRPNDLHSVNNNGTTPLMYAMTFASKTSNLDAMIILLDLGANPFKKDFNGKDVFEYALNYSNKKVINYLKKYQ